MTIDVFIISLFILANIFIGFWASTHIKSVEHYSVGNRAFNSFVIFATLSATFIGGGYTLGNAAKVYQDGMIYAFALLGFSLKEILVALFIAPRMDAHRDCLSIGDIMAKRYGVKAKIITGVFSMIVCAGILGAQVGAMGAVFHTFFDLPAVWGILVGFGVIILYSTLGGMRAVVYTDILQFCILVVGIPLTLFIALYHLGGIDAIVTKVPVTHLHFLNSPKNIVLFISLFITFIFGETLVPPYVQRLFMAKSAQHTKRGTLASGLLSIPFFLIAGSIGLTAYAINPSLTPNLAMPYVIQTVLPPVAKGFVIAGVLSIIMSSASGFLNAGAVAVVNDIVKPLAKKDLPRHVLLCYAKLSTLGIGIGSVIFALTIENVLSILLYAYNFWAPVVLIPLIAIIFNYPVRAKHFYTGAFAGIAAMLIWSIGFERSTHISAVVVGVAANFLFFIVSYKNSPKPLQTFKPT